MNFLVRKNHFSLHLWVLLSPASVASSSCLECVKLICELSCYIILDLLKASNYHKLYKAKEERGKTKQNKKMRIHSLDVLKCQKWNLKRRWELRCYLVKASFYNGIQRSVEVTNSVFLSWLKAQQGFNPDHLAQIVSLHIQWIHFHSSLSKWNVMVVFLILLQ